jgi:hypothetical protein
MVTRLSPFSRARKEAAKACCSAEEAGGSGTDLSHPTEAHRVVGNSIVTITVMKLDVVSVLHWVLAPIHCTPLNTPRATSGSPMHWAVAKGMDVTSLPDAISTWAHTAKGRTGPGPGNCGSNAGFTRAMAMFSSGLFGANVILPCHTIFPGRKCFKKPPFFRSARRMHIDTQIPYVRINTATPQHLVNKAFYRKTLHV